MSFSEINRTTVSKLFFFTLIFVQILLHSPLAAGHAQKPGHRGVTYTFSGGRFGDNLLAYLHAKWASHVFGCKLLYKPFPYSDQLMLHYNEKHYDKSAEVYKPIITLKYQEMFIPPPFGSYLFVIPYFPECLFEHQPKMQYPYFAVGWEDPKFVEEIKKQIKPLTEVPPFPFPEGTINLAIHLRTGRGHDTWDVEDAFPLKFPSTEYYLEQVATIYEFFDGAPIFAYIFTDDPEPEILLTVFQKRFEGFNIQFDARIEGNSCTQNVLEDFFSMAQFDCLIRGESNYALTAAKIANFYIEIYPVGFKRVNGKVLIDQVYIKTKMNH